MATQKERFLRYLQKCVKSTRSTDSNPLFLGGNAPKDYARFLEPDLLFDYNPSKWEHIGSMYNINEYSKAFEVFKELITDDAFIKRDKENNQGWRRGAISHYVCFLSAQEYFVKETSSTSITQDTEKTYFFDKPLQQIYYGAPGTGKSFEIKKQTTGKQVIRTTFHPDSDYSTFVGAYKPTTIEVPMRDVTGKVIFEDGEPVTENRIIYEFVQQAFLQAYTKAWKKYASATNDGKKPEEVYLVIEEINRGNCAQIFGDLFQLLDRGDNGFSEYPINADKDMRKQLVKAFTDMAFLNAPAISGMSSEQVALKIRNGEILLLPNNLYIWATMNTSDQSLFPIDSAFKRRWDWKYVPITDGKEGWQVEVNGKRYDWWEFLQKINDKIGYATNSEDKKLGYYFCKATNGVINAETFVGKVIFYIWNDVFKDFAEEAGDLFKDENDSLLSFNKFYIVGEDGKTKVVETKVEQFLKNLGIEFQLESFTEEVVEDEDGNDGFSNGRDYSKFSVNGVGRYPKNNLAAECMKQYIQLNPQMPIETVLAKWRALGDIVPHFVESKEEYDARTDNSKRSHELQCGDSVIYVAHNGYGSNGKVFTLIEAVNKQNWGLRLAKVEE